MTSFQSTAGSGGFSFSIFAPPQQAPPPPQVYRSQEGVGYPSCSRALAKLPPNINDANGYYETIGVQPWATEAEIKRALRKLMARYHPDNLGPDDDKDEALRMFMRLQEIAEVLLDPIHRANYNSIPKGRKLIDSEVKAAMEEAGITGDDPGVQNFATTPEDYAGKPDATTKRPKDKFWDYLATDHNELDLVNAQEWYAYLLELAPMFRYDATIKVLLHDGNGSAFKKEGGIMLVPRTWEPSSALAFAMFRRHIGWPKLVPHKEPEVVTTYSATGFAGTETNGGGGLLVPQIDPNRPRLSRPSSNLQDFMRPSDR